MSEGLPETVDPALREQYCFGCGRHNPIGLHLVFERDGDDLVAAYEPRGEDAGFPGMMHGGLATLLLDEAMGWAMYADRVFAVTAKMETRYRRPVELGPALIVRARLVSRRGRRMEIEGDIRDEAGDVLVEAKGLFMQMDPESEASALATFEAGSPGWTQWIERGRARE